MSAHGYQPSKYRMPVGSAVLLYDDLLKPPSLRQLVYIIRTGAHGEGKYSVPGGWLDKGEDPQDAAIREAWEEVGVGINTVRFLNYTHDRHPEGIEGVTMWFEALNWGGHPRNTNPDRITEVGLMPLTEFIGLGSDKLFCPVKRMIEKGIIAL